MNTRQQFWHFQKLAHQSQSASHAYQAKAHAINGDVQYAKFYEGLFDTYSKMADDCEKAEKECEAAV